jgi:hypothetical protein
MKELDVRRLLYQTEIRRVLSQSPKSRVVDELELLRGVVRVDVAVISDELCGYEIKSASDNLDRLPNQQHHYSKVFERMTLVCDEHHVEEAVAIVPKHWGLISVSMREGKPHASEIWPARRNYDIEPLALAQLLWREEAIELMEYFDLSRGMSNKPKKVLWQTLANNLSLEQLRTFVCFKLRNRKGWKKRKRSRI